MSSSAARPNLIFSIVLLLIAMVSIQGGAALAKTLFTTLGAQGTSTLRLGFAAFILVMIWRPWRRAMELESVKSIALYGLFLGSMNLLFYMSLERISLGLAVTLEFTGPLAIAFFASRRRVDFIWALLAGLGIVLILPITEASSAVDLAGVLYALGAGAAWALYILQGKKVGAKFHPGMVTSIGMTMAFLVVTPFGVAHSGATLLDWKVLPLGFVVALLSSAIPYSLEIVAMKNMSTRNFGVLMSIEPAVAAAAGLLILNERLAGLQWLAIACIIVASLGSSLSSRFEVEVPSPA